jgi:hypothetical protein
VSGVVVDRDGTQWWTTGYAVLQLGVSRHRLGDWVRRSRQAGHVAQADPDTCPACQQPGRFPHVDPPARSGRVAGYRAEQLFDAEAHTSSGRRGGRLRERL